MWWQLTFLDRETCQNGISKGNVKHKNIQVHERMVSEVNERGRNLARNVRELTCRHADFLQLQRQKQRLEVAVLQETAN